MLRSHTLYPEAIALACLRASSYEETHKVAETELLAFSDPQDGQFSAEHTVSAHADTSGDDALY